MSSSLSRAVIKPFKVRPNKCPMDVAEKIFGAPVGEVRKLVDGETTNSFQWRFYENRSEIFLEILHSENREAVEISMSTQVIGEDMTICGDYSRDSTAKKLRCFVGEVRKPWEEWSGEEIMESPMWVCLYMEDGNEVTPPMESMMHMASFQRPEDPWIKRYFRKSTSI